MVKVVLSLLTKRTGDLKNVSTLHIITERDEWELAAMCGRKGHNSSLRDRHIIEAEVDEVSLWNLMKATGYYGEKKFCRECLRAAKANVGLPSIASEPREAA